MQYFSFSLNKQNIFNEEMEEKSHYFHATTNHYALALVNIYFLSLAALHNKIFWFQQLCFLLSVVKFNREVMSY